MPFSTTGGNPANAGATRLSVVLPCSVPDTATALPKQARYQLRYTRLFSFLSGWSYSPKTLKNKLLTQKNRLKGGSSEKGGPSDRIRTCGILLPNLSGILFPLVYSGFQQFPICFTYSLTLLSPLFPGVPALSVVIYVVKNASRPVSGECSPMPSGKRFSLLLAAL